MFSKQPCFYINISLTRNFAALEFYISHQKSNVNVDYVVIIAVSVLLWRQRVVYCLMYRFIKPIGPEHRYT